MINDYLTMQREDDMLRIICRGEWTIATVANIEPFLRSDPGISKTMIDFGDVEQFDSTGILLLVGFQEKVGEENVQLVGLGADQQKMLEIVKKHFQTDTLPQRHDGLLYKIGKNVHEGIQELMRFFIFFGRLFGALGEVVMHPKNFRMREIVYHVEKSGVDALFIIGLTSALVGLVIAYQGAVQLTKFGADIFIVDTISLSMARELGPLITAIVIAGRSGSAYTAELGAMKITEEINAMRTMGFDPYIFLVIPRIIALTIAMPLLIFFSDIMGILGGMIVAKAQLGISYTFFIERLQEALDLKHYVVGISKAPFFAFIIAAVGSYRGFRVSRDTESIGRQTTLSVVNSIFLVIACDALFSVVLTELGI